MASTSPRSLSTAGSALIAAGFVAALTGGLYGLTRLNPGMVVLSVLLVIGYSVCGYLLLGRRDAAFRPAAVLAIVLGLATLWVFRPEVTEVLDPEFTYFLAFPALGYLLAYSAAHLAAYGFARRNNRVLWPTKGTEAVSPLLATAALVPVLSAFLLLYMDRNTSWFVIAGSLLAGAVTAWGGVISSIRRHPRYTLVGSAVGFLAGVAFLYEFAARGYRDFTYLGQLYSLASMLLTGFPIAMSVVAWVELEAAKKEHAHATNRDLSPPSAPRPPG